MTPRSPSPAAESTYPGPEDTGFRLGFQQAQATGFWTRAASEDWASEPEPGTYRFTLAGAGMVPVVLTSG